MQEANKGYLQGFQRFSGWPICSEFPHENPNPQAHMVFFRAQSSWRFRLTSSNTRSYLPRNDLEVTKGYRRIVHDRLHACKLIESSFRNLSEFGPLTRKNCFSLVASSKAKKTGVSCFRKKAKTNDFPVEETFATMLHKQRVRWLWHEASSRRRKVVLCRAHPGKAAMLRRTGTGSTLHLHNFECHFSQPDELFSNLCQHQNNGKSVSCRGFFDSTIRTGKSNSFSRLQLQHHLQHPICFSKNPPCKKLLGILCLAQVF